MKMHTCTSMEGNVKILAVGEIEMNIGYKKVYKW